MLKEFLVFLLGLGEGEREGEREREKESERGREREREREGESIRLPSVTCPNTDSITPCYSLSCGGVERHHLEDHL